MAHRGIAVKTLKKLLKKAGLKTTGKKATLTRRAKKAKLMKGGWPWDPATGQCEYPAGRGPCQSVDKECGSNSYQTYPSANGCKLE